MPNPVLTDLEATQGDRYRCPLCDARRGLSISPDEGQTGLWHCFSCQEGGTGAELYAAVHNVDIAEALDVYGVSSSGLSQKVKKKEKQAPRPTVPEKSDAEWNEMRRAWRAMSRDELWLRDRYRRRRAKAIHDRDRDAFDRWHEKYEQLHQHVLRREMRGQRKIQKIDSHHDSSNHI